MSAIRNVYFRRASNSSTKAPRFTAMADATERRVMVVKTSADSFRSE